jgi:hypothetical protein
MRSTEEKGTKDEEGERAEREGRDRVEGVEGVGEPLAFIFVLRKVCSNPNLASSLSERMGWENREGRNED